MKSLLTPDKPKVVFVILFFLLFDFAYYMLFRKMASFYLFIQSDEKIQSILTFQLIVNILLLPILWIFALGMIHLVAEILGGHGIFSLFLFQGSFIFVPLTIIVTILLLFLIDSLEQSLISQIEPNFDLKAITKIIQESKEIKLMNLLTYFVYPVSFLWICFRVKYIYSITFLKAVVAVITPFSLIYILSLLVI